MAAHDVKNVAYDGSVWKIRMGVSSIPLLKLGLPKEEVKSEKIRRIGEQVASVTTPGAYEAANFEAEMESAVYSRMLLPKMPLHGWTLFEFVITGTAKHPLVTGAYTIVMDRVRIREISSAIEAGEKATIVKIGFSVIECFHKGADSIAKSLPIRNGLPSPMAAQFLL